MTPKELAEAAESLRTNRTRWLPVWDDLLNNLHVDLPQPLVDVLRAQWHAIGELLPFGGDQVVMLEKEGVRLMERVKAAEYALKKGGLKVFIQLMNRQPLWIVIEAEGRLACIAIALVDA